jgi:hypothetical protein
VFVTVTTLVTGARGDGIVKVRVRTPKTVVSAPFVALVKLSVPDGPTTVNVTLPLVPPGVVTLTVLAESVAVPEIVKFALTVVAFTTVRPLTVIPVPETLIALAPVRLVPVRVTGTVPPRVPVVGLIEVRVGGGGATTVKVTLLLVPPGVVTLTVLAEVVAVPEIVKFAVTVVGFTTVRALTVIPVPETVIALVPVRLVPVRVTGTSVPRTPVFGAIEVNVGAGGGGATNSTAPGSNVPSTPVSGLGLPKKSVLGTRLKFGSEVGILSMTVEPAASA